jgi:hypothetical protein
VACVAVPRGKPLFRWQEDASGHAGRAGSLEQWISQARPTLTKLLPGCVFECLLPDAYYVNCRESDRRVRPFGIKAAVAFLENALAVKPDEVQAVVAGFGEERVDEYRVAFVAGAEGEVAHGVVWPLYGREDENARPGPLDEVMQQLSDCGVTEVKKLQGTVHARSTARTAARRSSPMPRARSSTPSSPRKPTRTSRTSTEMGRARGRPL